MLRQAAVYAAARIALSGLDVILLPFYARVLGPDQYGLVAIALTLLAALAFLLPLGLETAFTRFYFDHDADGSDRSRTLRSILFGIVASGVVISAVLTAVGPGLMGRWLTGMSPAFFRLLVWTGFLNSLFLLWLQLLQVRRQPVLYAWYAVSQAGLRAMLIVVSVAALGRGAVGWLEAYALSAVVGAVVASTALVRATADGGLDLDIIRRALRYGLPLALHQAGAWMTAFAGRLVLNQLMTLASVGIFQVALSLGQVLGLLTTAVNFAYAPYFMVEASKSITRAGERFGRFATTYGTVLIGLALVGSLFAQPIVSLVASERFEEAASLVPVVLGMFVVQGFYYLFANPIFFQKSMTKYLPIVTLSGGLVGITASYLLIPPCGVIGAAWAGLLGNLVIAIGAFPLSQRAVYMRYNHRVIAAAAAVAVLAVGASRSLSYSTPVGLELAINLVLVALYIVVAWRTGAVEPTVLRSVFGVMSGRE